MEYTKWDKEIQKKLGNPNTATCEICGGKDKLFIVSQTQLQNLLHQARQEKCKEISDKARQVGYANGYKQGKFDAEQDIDCAKTDS